jgi:hypothetical protein
MTPRWFLLFANLARVVTLAAAGYSRVSARVGDCLDAIDTDTALVSHETFNRLLVGGGIVLALATLAVGIGRRLL